MRLNRASSLFLALAAASSALASTAAAEEDNHDDQCGLYLAVSSSSTAEEPKWGIYAGKELDKNLPVGFGEVALQTFHLMANAMTEDQDEEDEEVEFFEQYIWVPHGSGGQFELADGGRTVTAIPGAGVLGGYNVRLTNSDWNHSSAYHREAWNEEPGVAHPGRGAYSNFFNVGMKSTQKIPAGMEIFVNYGDNWGGDDDEEDEKSEILRGDHAKIDETIDKMIEFFDKHSADLDEESKQEIYQFLIKDVMAAAAGTKKGAKIAAMLPESPDDLKLVKEEGGSLKLLSPTAVRSLDWLAQHGRCMDNIKPGPSTIPHAGRGALANRDIPTGGLVAPVPLVQIVNEDILDMYDVKRATDENDEDYFVRNGDEPVGTQLLLNYCYGHPESSMLFFPSGAISSFINHSKEPNAKLVWSDHPNHHKHWFDMEPESLMTEGNRHLGLLMEIVAIKEIKEGEEVFMDYGDDWVEAWEEHVKDWEAAVKKGDLPSPWPTRALDLNQEHITKPFENEAEYPDNVMLKCFLMVKKPENEPPINDKGEKIRHWTESKTTMNSENVFDCTVIDREETIEGQLYTIRWTHNTETTIVKKVPHKAIVFMDKPGTSDSFIAQSFRHSIQIPDDVYPQGPWRNVIEDDE